LQTARHHIELQHTYRSKNQITTIQRFENLYRAFFNRAAANLYATLYLDRMRMRTSGKNPVQNTEYR